MNKKLRSTLARQPLPFFGLNGSGTALGDDDGYDTKLSDEDFDDQNQHDPLVELTDEVGLLRRYVYADMGMFPDRRFFLRAPAIRLLKAYDVALQEIAGWRVRVWDPFRSPEDQISGAKWGTEATVKNLGIRGGMDFFLDALNRALQDDVTTTTLSQLETICKQADRFFSYVDVLPYVTVLPLTLAPQIIKAAANFQVPAAQGLLSIDRMARKAHASGGVADIEWVDTTTGLLVNMGSHDNQGLEGAFPYFEPGIAPILAPGLAEYGLASFEERMYHYRRMVGEKPYLQEYLTSVGVDWRKLMEDGHYLEDVCLTIRNNRRIAVGVGEMYGIKQYGLETWHADLHDALGGVQYKRTGIPNGGGGYAVYTGQKNCAWGCAVPLYDRIMAKSAPRNDRVERGHT